MTDFEYTINGSPTTITRQDTETEVGVDTLLYHGGFQRYSSFDLYFEDDPSGEPLQKADIAEEDEFIAVPRRLDDAESWRS